MPTPRFQTGVVKTPSAQPNAQTASTNSYTTDEAVTLDGSRALIRGVETPTRVPMSLKDGDIVTVLWEGQRPKVILNMRGQHGAGTDEFFGQPGVVEELFMALVDGVTDIYYRSIEQVTALKIRPLLDGDPLWVKWGTNGTHFLVMTALHHYYVFKINHAKDVPLVGTKSKATLVRDEKPLDANIVLCTASRGSNLSGTTHYFDQVFDEDMIPIGFSEGASYPITYSMSQSGNIRLTRTLIEGTPAPKGFFSNVELDDALDIILTIYADIDSASIIDSSTVTSDTHLIKSEPSIGDVQAGEGDEASDEIGQRFFHAFIVNATKGTILFRTTKAAVSQSTTKTEDRFDTYKETSVIGQPIFEFAHFRAFTIGDTVTDTISINRGLQVGFASPFVSSRSYDVYSDALTYLDLGGLFSVDSSDFVEKHTWSGLGVSDPSDTALQINVHKEIPWQSKNYALAAFYLSRRASEFNSDGSVKTLPKGLVLIKVREQTLATRTDAVGTFRFGLFLHDLEGGAITTLSSFETNLTGKNQQGITANGTQFTAYPPEGDQVFIVLGFNGTHLLWVHTRQPTSGDVPIATVKLTRVSDGMTSVVVQGDQFDTDKGVAPGNPGYADNVHAYFAREQQLLRPDFLWDPDTEALVAKKTQKQIFVKAWTTDGTPTLDSTVAKFPIEENTLKGIGLLKKLPKGVTEQVDAIYTKTGGPINVEDSHEGPDYHVVNAKSLINPKFFRKDF